MSLLANKNSFVSSDSIWSRRGGDRSFNIRDAVSENSSNQSSVGDLASWIICPIAYLLCFSECGKESGVISISSLTLHCDPSAIVWLVMAVVVFSVYRKIVSVPVGKGPLLKRMEAVPPFLADLYPSTAVPMIASIQRVAASANNGMPSFVDFNVTRHRNNFTFDGRVAQPLPKFSYSQYRPKGSAS